MGEKFNIPENIKSPNEKEEKILQPKSPEWEKERRNTLHELKVLEARLDGYNLWRTAKGWLKRKNKK